MLYQFLLYFIIPFKCIHLKWTIYIKPIGSPELSTIGCTQPWWEQLRGINRKTPFKLQGGLGREVRGGWFLPGAEHSQYHSAQCLLCRRECWETWRILCSGPGESEQEKVCRISFSHIGLTSASMARVDRLAGTPLGCLHHKPDSSGYSIHIPWVSPNSQLSISFGIRESPLLDKERLALVVRSLIRTHRPCVWTYVSCESSSCSPHDSSATLFRQAANASIRSLQSPPSFTL